MPNLAIKQRFSPKAKQELINNFLCLASSFFSSKLISRKLSSIKKFPALLSLMIQMMAFAMVICTSWLIVNISGYFSYVIHSLPMVLVVLMQAFYASSAAKVFNMAIWWRWIHFVFPIFVWLMLMFDVPNEFYLVGFLITLSIFWTSFHTQVPYYPSRIDVWQQMASIAEQLQKQHSSPLRIIDIGSGLGGLSLYLAKHQQNMQIEGIEIAPLPWLVSRLRTLIHGSKVLFRLGNYHALNFADYDIVFAYLSPAAMADLWKKSRQEMRQGSLLISLEFEIPDLTPTDCIVQKGQGRALFVYKIS